MANFSDFVRNATAAVGALVIGGAVVAAAVVPAETAGARNPAPAYVAVEAPVSVQARA